MKREKIFVGLANYIGWNIMPCILFTGSNTPATAHSIAGVAHQQSDVLGKNWTSKITFSSPTSEVLTDEDDKKFTLVEFDSRSIATFTETMERSLSGQEDEEAEER
jgi:hypothetical protein